MGTSGSKGRGLRPFTATAGAAGQGGSPELTNATRAQHALAPAPGFRTAPPFVFIRRGLGLGHYQGDKGTQHFTCRVSSFPGPSLYALGGCGVDMVNCAMHKQYPPFSFPSHF
uniref:Uncharacterized protein n=1 Tax=Vombatus ursinus TaxID=29139 RepID=A0A4X2L785_VOMUR